MDELARLMDWDLQAITGNSTEASANMMGNNPHLSFSHLCSELDDLLCNFQEFSETKRVVDELEALYKPFYPVLSNSDPSIVTSSQTIPEEVKVLKPSGKVAVQDLQDAAASKCKRRRNKQKKKRVEHVRAADGVSHDPWAWRKYGQKPIKGSPYPRSYYRCSSSKACLARKKVERSHLDPGVLIVTYTAEHSHPHPTCKRRDTGKTSFTSIAPPKTHDPKTPVVVEPIVPSIESEQSMGLKKVEDVVEGDGWFSSIQLDELHGYGFRDTSFA